MQRSVGDNPSRPWDAAGSAAKAQAATWYKWCDRHGWDYHDPHDHRRWERKQFRAALRLIPKDHPDRWKYVIGARWAPTEGGLLAVAISLSLGVLIASIPASINTGVFIWAIVWPAMILGWSIPLYLRYRSLST